jgi:glycolate oxidase FAD binding subunit
MTAGGVPAELVASCPDVRAASPADVIAGVPARYVAWPASTEEASTLLQAAAALGLTVVPRGSGRRQHWGNPPASCDLIVDTRRMNRVIEHASADLVASVQAGVRLRDLEVQLETAGQSLRLDAFAHLDGGTVGGVIATNATGSRRYRYGTPRELLTGITVVLADGTIARSGSQVVRNVAGYDLARLFAGSYGSFGLITEATFRLHPLPGMSMGAGLQRQDAESAAAAIQALWYSPLAPCSIDLRWPSANAPIWLTVGLEGDRESVRARHSSLRELLGPALLRHIRPPANGATVRKLLEPGHEWQPKAQLRTPRTVAQIAADMHDHAALGGTLVRIAFWVGQLARVLTLTQSAAAVNRIAVSIEGPAGAGVLEVKTPVKSAPTGVARFVDDLRAGLNELSKGTTVTSVASAVVVYAPAEVRDLVDIWGPVPSPGLTRAVKDQFDPEHRMAPGRFNGGIS